MKNYEYLKENTRYSVLFGMDFTLNLIMFAAWFYLHKQIHDSISVKLLLTIKKSYGFFNKNFQEIIYLSVNCPFILNISSKCDH